MMMKNDDDEDDAEEDGDEDDVLILLCTHLESFLSLPPHNLLITRRVVL